MVSLLLCPCFGMYVYVLLSPLTHILCSAASLALLCKFLSEMLYFISDFGELCYGVIHTQLIKDF